MDYTNYDYQKPQTEIVRYHGANESDSAGMTNHSSSCWMICVMQALGASEVFTSEYKPVKNEHNSLKKELFRLFDIVRGKNGQKKRKLKSQEVVDFRELVRASGLPVKKTGGYSEVRFMNFLLKQLEVKPVEYYAGSKKQKELLFTVHPTDTPERRSLEDVIKENRLSLVQAPKFLPILLKRPHIAKHQASRTPVEPSSTLTIALRDGSKARYKLVSIVIGRDSISHSYCYVLEKSGWVEYNNSKAVIHSSPKTKKRTKDSVHTPYEDACKHSEMLIYELLNIG